MKKKRFTEEQIAYAMRQHEAGTTAADLCWRMGISTATFYQWKKKYSGMGVSELREMKQLRDENANLERLVADCRSTSTCSRKSSKKTVRPARKRPLVQYLIDRFEVSGRRACERVGLGRSTWWYRSHKRDRTGLRMRLRELAAPLSRKLPLRVTP